MSQCCARVIRKIQSPKIETDECGKAKSFRLFSIKRPHMRSFHSSWFCFFVAFTSWFGIQPLLPTIRKELGLSKIDLANSGTASIAATIAIRILIGPLCDRFGPKRIMCGLLLCGAIPVALSGLVKNATGLIILRLFVGILGGTFVPCQFWTTATFNSEIVGTANALVGGWGNLGGGFTFILMPNIFELVKLCGADEFLAWKIAIVIPAVICIITGISIIFTSDDCPQGKWENRILPTSEAHLNADDVSNKEGKTLEGFENAAFEEPMKTDKSTTNEGSSKTSLKYLPSSETLSLTDKIWVFITVGIFIIQYGMCFGVEISVNTVMNLYFLYTFKKENCTEIPPLTNITQPTENITQSLITQTSIPFITTTTTETLNPCSILDQNSASLITSLFGLMNLFARALGGILSDVVFRYRGIPGRLLMHLLCLAVEGVMLIVFSQMETITTAVAAMVVSSLFLQMSEGTTYALVPYIVPKWVGTIAGLVGAGGNCGALIWTSLWSLFVVVDPRKWFWIIGIIVSSGSLLTFISEVQGFRLWNICSRKKSYDMK